MLILLAGLLLGQHLNAQMIPSHPLSIPTYHPMVLNPAYAGSKDFTSIAFTTKALKSPSHQIATLHTRLGSDHESFTPFGLGAYIFQNQAGSFWRTGFSAAGAYHFRLDKEFVHMLSIGAALKGMAYLPKETGESQSEENGNHFNPNMDLGLYYYGPSAFAGISATTIFGTRTGDDLPMDSPAYIPRYYHFNGGYKFMVNRASGIVIEPSMLVSVTDSTFGEMHRHIVPYLKLYLQNFYVGTCIKPLRLSDFWSSIEVYTLFFQYQFPRFYTGVYLEFPKEGFLNDDNIIFELSLGINLSKEGESFMKYRHW